VFCRLGYEGECKRIQDLYLDGKRGEAAAAVTTKMVEDTALIGPIGKIKDELQEWKRTSLTTIMIGGGRSLEQIAELVLG
jgi:hypothetical protein